LSAGLEVFQRGGFRPLRTSWLNVGTNFLSFYFRRRAITPTPKRFDGLL
jgi:hypothetical protein